MLLNKLSIVMGIVLLGSAIVDVNETAVLASKYNESNLHISLPTVVLAIASMLLVWFVAKFVLLQISAIFMSIVES